MAKETKQQYFKVMTPKFRVSFAHVFEKGKGYRGGPGKYSVVMIFPKKTDLSDLKKACRKAVIARFGSKDKGGWPSDIKWPWKDGDELGKSGRPEYKASIIIKAGSKNRPGVVASDGETD